MDPKMFDDLPPTPFEIEEARHAKISAENAHRERARLHRDNRRAGHPVPKDGDTFYVSLDRTVPRRTRSGLKFEKDNPRVAVQIRDLPDAEIAEMQRSGVYVVGIEGAERLLEDAALHVHHRAQDLDDRDVEALRAQTRAVEEELKTTREELKRLRDARMNAPDKGDGRPSRIPAGQAAGAKPAGEAAEDFGPPPAKK